MIKFSVVFWIGISGVLVMSCVPQTKEEALKSSITPTLTKVTPLVFVSGDEIATRFDVPKGYQRIEVMSNSFPAFLRALPLKPSEELVTYYNGEKKLNDNIYAAVVDLPIGKKDLHQCADAVMRLRMDYLYEKGRYEEIHFNFTNGFQVDYTEYMAGKRMVINGNRTYWKPSKQPSNTAQDFRTYKELIYMYAGTLSLSRELKSIPISAIQIGDIFIQGGSPGHAIIVVDMAENEAHDKIIMLAQSYMPAQEIQILMNPLNAGLSPWFSLSETDYLHTPEWDFEWEDLKRF